MEEDYIFYDAASQILDMSRQTSKQSEDEDLDFESCYEELHTAENKPEVTENAVAVTVNDSKENKPIVSQWNLLIPTVLTAIYVTDIILDFILTRNHFSQNEIAFSVLTLTYFYISSSVVTRFGYKIRRKQGKNHPWYLTMAFFLTNSEPIYHYSEMFCIIRNAEKNNLLDIYEIKMTKILLIIMKLSWRNALHRSLPRFMLQSSVILNEIQSSENNDGYLMFVLQIIAIISGILNCLITLILWLRQLGILAKCISLTMYIVDVFSDIILAFKYLLSGQYLHSALTGTFVFLPSFLITFYSFRRRHELPLTSAHNVTIFILLALACGEPILHYVRHIRLLLLKKETNDFQESPEQHEAFVAENKNVCWLRLWEGYLEAVPQLTLQLTIMITTLTFFTVPNNWTLYIQIVTVCTSFIGLIVTTIDFDKAVSLSLNKEMSVFGYFMTIITRLPWLVARVVSTAVLASVESSITFSIYVLHLAVSGFWWYQIWYRKQERATKFKVLGALADSLRSMISPPVSGAVTPFISCVHIVVQILEVSGMTAAWVFLTEGVIGNDVFLWVVCSVTLACSFLGTLGTVFYMIIPTDKYYK